MTLATTAMQSWVAMYSHCWTVKGFKGFWKPKEFWQRKSDKGIWDAFGCEKEWGSSFGCEHIVIPRIFVVSVENRSYYWVIKITLENPDCVGIIGL